MRAIAVVSITKDDGLAEAIAVALGATVIPVEVYKFKNNEISISIDHELKGVDVIVIASTFPEINDALIKTMLLISSISNSHPNSIQLVMPYMAYSRQDKVRPKHNIMPIHTFSYIFQNLGVNNIITVDCHSVVALEQLGGFICNIESAPLMLPAIPKDREVVIISPDKGGMVRAAILAELAKVPYAYMQKIRQNGECIINAVSMDIKGKTCIIVDDIVDSGATLLSASECLIRNGAVAVSAYVTHAICADEVLSMIGASHIDALYISDSVVHHEKRPGLQVLSLAELLARAINHQLALTGFVQVTHG